MCRLVFGKKQEKHITLLNSIFEKKMFDVNLISPSKSMCSLLKLVLTFKISWFEVMLM